MDKEVISVYYQLKTDELIHYGIKGMHWGIRRYQSYPSDRKTARKSTASTRHNLLELSNIQSINEYNKSAISKKKKKLSKINPAKKKKIERIKKKIEKLEADKKFLEEKDKEYRKETQKIIDQMSKKGYSFRDMQFKKDKNKTKQPLNTLIQEGKKHADHSALMFAQQQMMHQQQIQQEINRQNQQIFDLNNQIAQQIHMDNMNMHMMGMI